MVPVPHRRVRARPGGRERGSALVELVVLEALLVVPLIYLVITLARVQAGSFAVATAAREAGRAYVTASSGPAAPVRADAAARVAFEDQGFGGGEGQVAVRCEASPCLSPDAHLWVEARVRVPLPLVPGFARAVLPLDVTLRATHVVTVDRFREVP
jgi:hypothetical protein